MPKSDTKTILLLKSRLGIEENLDVAVSELLADYDHKYQALAEREKQERQFQDFMEALAVKLKKANALTMVGALEEIGNVMALLDLAYAQLLACKEMHKSLPFSFYSNSLKLWFDAAKKQNVGGAR